MLKIRFGLWVLVFLFTGLVNAQNRIQVQGSAPQLHLVHTVVAKETWYSVGRIYNLSPKDIAAFNKTTIEKPLAIAQTLQIPLTAVNFSQDGQKAGDEVFVPLYHQVQEKEWMYRISTRYNKVPVEALEKWNNVKNDQLKSGMWIVVGYLKVKTGQSPLAASGTGKVAAPPVKEEAKKPETAKVDPPKPEPVKTEPVKPEPVKPEPAKEEPKVTEQPAPGTPANHKGGAFRRQYEESGATITGNSGVFRSTSGWNDGKYYALMNNVPVGTIVKVTFSSTNKTIYAKVLGQLPEMRESVGLSLRISDAAASELGVTNPKFYVDVKY